ncbi:MAG: CheR family methyltransferase [Desulfobacteraceae bacterium]|jgi:chemotaxis protein methyltransferase CheR
MLSDQDFRMLLEHFDRPWSGYRKVRKGVKKRLRRHMNQLGCTGIDAYLQKLKHSPDHNAVAEQCLRVTISRFFRDRGLWRFLHRELFPEIRGDLKTPIRIWSAGCAGGEEPYSITVTWVNLFGTWNLDILATDVQAACLDRAKAGIYTASSLKEVPSHLRSAFFEPLRKKRRWRIRQSKLPQIRWEQHHLFDPPPEGSFHVIFLRNSLLTYHQGSLLRSTLSGILSTLNSGGYFIVGSHETVPSSFPNLSRIENCPWVYRLTA